MLRGQKRREWRSYRLAHLSCLLWVCVVDETNSSGMHERSRMSVCGSEMQKNSDSYRCRGNVSITGLQTNESEPFTHNP